MTTPRLLTRDDFRNGVFARDGHKCIFCDAPAKDAHHIIERRLFVDGGYYLDNGVSVCEEHHLACERTDIAVEDVRLAAKITRKVVPPHLYADQQIDKWGNPVLPNGTRLRGELFYDESVQKIIAGHLHEFSPYVKYPRTNHISWSPGMNDDDRRIENMGAFVGQRVIVSAKMDGEQTTMYSDYIHARSIDSRHHVSRDWVKNFWSSIAHDIPEGWRVCGENLFAQHSIAYDELPSYLLGFSVWNEANTCLSWDDTLDWFKLLGIVPVDVLYDGIYDEKKLHEIEKGLSWEKDEGYVLRVADAFAYGEFRHKAAKWVRKGHVMTAKHWMHGQAVVPNKLRA